VQFAIIRRSLSHGRLTGKDWEYPHHVTTILSQVHIKPPELSLNENIDRNIQVACELCNIVKNRSNDIGNGLL
jgi:hypothetical protein